jgi:hypothetical protein
MSPRLRWFAPLALLAAMHAVVLTTAFPSSAQNRSPQDLVARGRALFDDQQYEESIQTLSAALVRPINTKSQKVEIYRLLALDYITLGRKDEAESAVRGLLSLEPDYTLPPAESPRFRDFFTDVKQRWEGEGRPGLVKETAAAPPPVSMRHNSPSQVDPRTQIDLTARLDDAGHRVESVKLFYRSGSHGKFDVTDASLDGGSVRASVPPEAVRPPLVEYYLQGFDKGGLAIVSRGDAGMPLRIAVPEPSRGWILPVAIGGGVLAAAAVVGGLFLAGVFNSKSPGGGNPNMNPPPAATSQVMVVVGP